LATVYSLVCFGGRTGKTVTFTDAGDVVNLTNHGLIDGTGIVFSNSGGALPPGLTAGTAYYSKQGADSNKFTLWTDATLTTQVTFTGTGSGTHTVKSLYFTNLTTDQLARYGSPGSERIYDGLISWNTARAGASAYDTEICEIGEQFIEITSSDFSITVPSAASTVTTSVNGVRTNAFHAGSYLDGYIFKRNESGANPAIVLSQYRSKLDGFTVLVAGVGYSNSGVSLSGPQSECTRMFAVGRFDGNGNGFQASTALVSINNCVSIGWNRGIYVVQYNAKGAMIANNLCAKNTTGITGSATTNIPGFYYNNISIGNTTNWGTATGQEGASNNYGLGSDTIWTTSGGTSLTIATTDFVDYTNNDFHPALSTSPQVETGVEFYGAYPYDIANDVRPNYIDGTTDAYDGGPYEFDHGNGLKPETHTIDFSGLVAGSQVVVYTTGTTTEKTRNDSTGTTLSWDAAAPGVTVDYTVMKAGYLPIHITGVALTATSTPIVIEQQLDRAYSASSGLTFGTDAIVNVSSLAVTSMQVTKATTVQNWYSFLIECWLDSSTNTTLKNVPFPVITFGEASFTLVDGIEFSDGATSISYFSRDGLRYASDSVGLSPTAVWAAILTLGTSAGLQVKYRQTTSGTIYSAANTGPMDQLVQVYGDASHGNFDYRDHMVLKVQAVGYSQPKPDLVATYGNLQDGLYVAGLNPILQYACTDADIDATHLVLDNTAKTFVVSASHTMAELYQRAQWWSNQDAQWDADVPMTTLDGNTYTLETGWVLSGLSNITGSGTISGGTCVLDGPGTYAVGFSGTTVEAQEEGTYTITAGAITLTTAPTADDVHYNLGLSTLTGTLTVHNTTAHPIVVEVPTGVTTSTTGNTGGAITFSAPGIYQSVTVSGGVAGSRIQIYDLTSDTELYNDTPTFPYTWTDPSVAAATREIRLRVAYCVGADAYEFIDANIGTCATSGSGKDISYLISQTADVVYNTNAIDGSTVTGITITTGPDRVNINLSGGSTTWPRIYAYQVYWQATATGIAQETAFIRAVDTANYILTDFSIKNTNANPLTITGGWGKDSVTGTIAGCIDAAGSTGNIYPEPDHVVAFQTSGTYAITGDISTVMAGISGVPAAVLSAAESSPIHSDAPSAAENAAAFWADPKGVAVHDMAKIHGVVAGSPLVVTPTTRTAGDVSQTITQVGETVTVERV
jgi:hypothetical protein